VFGNTVLPMFREGHSHRVCHIYSVALVTVLIISFESIRALLDVRTVGSYVPSARVTRRNLTCY
jgi:hypothetical protein